MQGCAQGEGGEVMKRFLCWLLGHRSICLFRYHSESASTTGSDITSWKCERCGTTFTEQWDT